jgi:hypothetical protein
LTDKEQCTDCRQWSSNIARLRPGLSWREALSASKRGFLSAKVMLPPDGRRDSVRPIHQPLNGLPFVELHQSVASVFLETPPS